MSLYKIQNSNTKLFFSRFAYFRGYTKAGKPRKTGPGTQVPLFTEYNRAQFLDIDGLNRVVRFAILNGSEVFFEDTEIIAYQYAPVKTTLRMKTVRNRHEGKIIMEKLRAK